MKKRSPEARFFEEAVSLLSRKHKTVTFAESCTGGLLAAALTEVPGASEVFPGSFVTYAEAVKQQYLGVTEMTLKDHGVVSAPCAMEMAKGARAATGADIAMSVTGVAGPGGGTDMTPVGLIFIGVSSPRGTRAYRFRFCGSGKNVRQINRQAALSAAGFLLLSEAKFI